MKVKELLQALGDIDDKYLAEEYVSVSKKAENEKENFKRKEVIVMSKKILSIAAVLIIAVVIIGVGVINKNNNGKIAVTDLLQIANPITELDSEEEMKKYLGFDVPVLDKEVESYIVIGEDKYATHARIIYKDGTVFEMEKGDKDVSGIYGATLEKEETISDIKVSFYSLEELKYATWENNGFSYSYSNSNGNVDVSEIIELTK